jgi:hypothetical protein
MTGLKFLRNITFKKNFLNNLEGQHLPLLSRAGISGLASLPKKKGGHNFMSPFLSLCI